jgi:hypothetical protein
MSERQNSAPDLASGNPTSVDVPLVAVAAQIKRDLFDKEVQSAATYSYLWMADQMGHIALGLIVVFALTWVLALAQWIWAAGNWPWAPSVAGCIIVAIWEIRAYRAFAVKWTKVFRSDNGMLAWNALTATIYMIIGVVLGFAWQQQAGVAATVTLVSAIVALALGGPWVRQKIVWQKAGLPFLFRLANANRSFEDATAKALEELLDRYGENRQTRMAAPAPIVILSGALGAGKTSLACGIGTECAFAKLKVRYTTFDKLAQMAATTQDDLGPDNINYWPWLESEVLIIDDVQSGAQYDERRTHERVRQTLRMFNGQQKFIGRRLSIWVLGPLEPDEMRAWEETIKTECYVAPAPEPLTVRFLQQAARP